MSPSQINEFARRMVALSKDDSGIVREEAIKEVLAVLEAKQFRNRVAILRALAKYVALEQARATAIIEHAGDLSEETVDVIATSLSKTYNRKITPQPVLNEDLILGVRVRVGDDVYDSSAAGQLERLARYHA